MIERALSTLVPLTKELADEFAGMNKSFCERLLSEKRLGELKKELFPKPLLSFLWVIAEYESKFYRVNGQHTSTLFSRGILPIPEDGEVLFQHYLCDTVEEVSELWGRFDSSVSSRTKRDIVYAWSQTDSKLATIPKHFGMRAMAGVKFAMRLNGISNRELGQLVIKNKENILFARRIIPCTTKHKFMYRAPVIAAMLVTKAKDEKAALEFWSMGRIPEVI